MKSNFKVIGFDADDTLWVNEPYYRETEDAFCDWLSDFDSLEKVSRELFKTEMQNLELYGFGTKAFMLSLIETALRVSDHKVSPAIIQEIIQLGKAHLNKPIEIMSDKKETDYLKLLKHLEIRPADFLMVGNYMRSDIHPVLNIGGYAIHIPFHITWLHEEVLDIEMSHEHFQTVENISLLPGKLNISENHIP